MIKYIFLFTYKDIVYLKVIHTAHKKTAYVMNKHLNSDVCPLIIIILVYVHGQIIGVDSEKEKCI